MALSQYQVDPSTLNLSGKPGLSQGPATNITSPGSPGMPGPVMVKESASISPGAGAALGALAGLFLGNRTSSTGTSTNPSTTPKPTTTTPKPTVTPSTSGNTQGTAGTDASAVTFKTNPDGSITVTDKQGSSVTYDKNGKVIKSNVPAYTPDTTGVGSVDTTTGTTIGGMTGNMPSIQTDANGNFVNTKTNEYVEPIGNNLFKTDSGNIINEAGTQVFPNYKPITETPTTLPVDPNTGDPAGTTNIGNNYYEDTSGNIYDAGGNLIYQNPSPTGGGGYTPDTTPSTTASYYKDANGNIYDSGGDLVLAYSNNYYYEPDTGSFYDTNFDPVSNDFNPYIDYYGLPTYGDYGDTSSWDNSWFDTGTVVKDGGSIHKKAGGLATPLFAKGGNVKGYADGDLVTTSTPTSFTDQVVANQVPNTTSTGTSTTPTATATSTGGVLDTISNLVGNPAISGALLGTLISQILSSTGTPNVNKGVDMSKIGAIQPRTTTYGMGPAKFVPYSQYGTPTGQADYSQLYGNLGVSPNAYPAQTTPTTNTNAPSTSTPTGGGLSTITNPPTTTSPTQTTPPTTTPQYYTDADGNIYDANGDLVFDTTSNQTTGAAQSPLAPSASPLPGTTTTNATSIAPTGGLSSMPATPEAINSYYTYGSDVTPSQTLGVKKGGTIKMAAGGLMPQGNLNAPTTDRPNSNIPEVTNPIVNNRIDYRNGSYVEGPGDGQSDDIPAMLADGEYVIDAETVAQLGNGSNKAGAKILDGFRENIRAHKRNTPLNKIPPKAKSPLAYLKGAK